MCRFGVLRVNHRQEVSVGLTWLVAWMNSCALVLLAMLASSILKSSAVTERRTQSVSHRDNHQ